MTIKCKLNYVKLNRGNAENVNKWIASYGGIKFMKSMLEKFPGGHGLTRYFWKHYNYPGTDAGIKQYLKKHGIDLVDNRNNIA